MRTSESITKLAEALAQAQTELTNAIRDEKNPHFGNEYASLASATNTIRPAFAKHGLSVVQMPEHIGSEVFLTTRLLHSSGEWMESEYPIKPVKPDPQGYGSALTYARRYVLMAVAGIAPEDDDGNAASHGDTAPPAQDDGKAPSHGKTAPPAQPRHPSQPKQPQNGTNGNGQRKPWFTHAQMLEVFARLASQYEAAGLRPEYDEILAKHGVKTADEFGNGDVARACYADLIADMANREVAQ